jgi:hypothetical protein
VGNYSTLFPGNTSNTEKVISTSANDGLYNVQSIFFGQNTTGGDFFVQIGNSELLTNVTIATNYPGLGLPK